MVKGKDKSIKKILLFLWAVFLLLGCSNFFKVMVPNHDYYNINNPYTKDSMWDGEENEWHNDMLLNTLFSYKTVYINPYSWYVDYVEAFAENIEMDEAIPVFYEDGNVTRDDVYTCVNHMVLLVNSTLFEEDIRGYISSNAPEGAPYLYIHESSLLNAGAIEVFHDQNGNMYLKGHADE